MNLRRLTSLYIASKNTELSANLQFICESDGIDVSEHRYLNILYLCTQELCLNFPCIPSLPTVCTYKSYKIKNMLSEVCMETVFPCSIQSFNREAGFLKSLRWFWKDTGMYLRRVYTTFSFQWAPEMSSHSLLPCTEWRKLGLLKTSQAVTWPQRGSVSIPTFPNAEAFLPWWILAHGCIFQG